MQPCKTGDQLYSDATVSVLCAGFYGPIWSTYFAAPIFRFSLFLQA